jgi:hypothetical protein
MIVELELPARAAAGAEIPITLRARNTGTRPVELILAGRPIAFDLLVTTPDGILVWQRLHAQVIAMALQIRLLQPGEVLEFTHRWEQRDNTGHPVAPGTYHVQGVLPAEDAPLHSPIQVLVIEG